jgi:hypothetical protein
MWLSSFGNPRFSPHSLQWAQYLLSHVLPQLVFSEVALRDELDFLEDVGGLGAPEPELHGTAREQSAKD